MKNLKNASRASKAKTTAALISKLGVDKSQFDVGSALSVLEEAAGEFIQVILNNIEKADIITTGEITNITAETNEAEKSVTIKAPPHFFYQSEGVNGTETNRGSRFSFSGRFKSVNVEAIKTWISVKGITPNDISRDSLAFIIARSIYKDGIEAKDLYQKDLQQFIDDSANKIADYTIKVII